MLFYLVNGIIIKAFKILYISMSMIILGIKCIKMRKFEMLEIQMLVTRLNPFSLKKIKIQFLNNDSPELNTIHIATIVKLNVYCKIRILCILQSINSNINSN